MTDKLRESVSALVDGEHPHEDVAGVIGELTSDEQLRAQWASHHLIGDAIRAALPRQVTTGLARQVRQLVDAEPVQLPTRQRRNRVLRPVVGFALAASVATLAIIGVRSIERPITPELPLVGEVQQPRSRLPVTILASGNRWNVEPRSVETRLNTYLVNHSEYAGYGVQGMLPYARIVGYDTSQP